MKRLLPSSRWLALALLSACAGEKLTIGQQLGPTELPDSSDGGGTIITPAEAPECPVLDTMLALAGRPGASGADIPEVVGTWHAQIDEPVYYHGYHEVAAELPSGPMTLRLDADGGGILIFGSEPAPPAPSSNTDPYLCSGASIEGGCHETGEIIPGFVYHLGNVQLQREDEQLFLQAEIFRSEPWAAWCEMQTPRAEPQPCFAPTDACVGPPPCDLHFIGPAPTEVDLAECTVSDMPAACDWLAAIREAPCLCDKDGCSSAGSALSFRLLLSSDAQTLRGGFIQSPIERDMAPLSFQRQ